jgi:hypothetical protein
VSAAAAIELVRVAAEAWTVYHEEINVMALETRDFRAAKQVQSLLSSTTSLSLSLSLSLSSQSSSPLPYSSSSRRNHYNPKAWSHVFAALHQ